MGLPLGHGSLEGTVDSEPGSFLFFFRFRLFYELAYLDSRSGTV